MHDILGTGRPSNADAVRRIKGWVRNARGPDDGATIMVSELHCHEPGCPEVETVIAVMKPAASVSRSSSTAPSPSSRARPCNRGSAGRYLSQIGIVPAAGRVPPTVPEAIAWPCGSGEWGRGWISARGILPRRWRC